MQWSQLKKRIETTFAESVQGRIEVWATCYRHVHDHEGEAWITFDKVRMISMGTLAYRKEANEMECNLQELAGCTDYRNPEHSKGYYNAIYTAKEIVHKQGRYSLCDAYGAFFGYLGLSMEEILTSENSIIKALGMLDKRFGRRRLKVFQPKWEGLLVKKLYECRCRCEGLFIPDSSLDSDGQGRRSA